MAQKKSLKSTIAVSLTNYLDAGAIVAGASGLSLWQQYLGLTEGNLGWLNAISANCLGAAIGAIIGGFLADKYGRKAIYTYNMLIYMLGVALVMVSVNFPMLLLGFLVTGISVGVGVPASWTYISENSEVGNRGRNIGISQMAWGIGPLVILLTGTVLAPPTGGAASGVAYPLVEWVGSFFGVAGAALHVFSSRIVFFSLFVVAFIAWQLQRRLDESAEWQAAKAEAEKAPKAGSVFASFGKLFTNRTNIYTMLFLAGMYLTWNLVCSVMGFFQPHIYETAGGLSNEYANMLSAGQWVIIILTTFVFSLIVDKVNQRWLYALGVSFGVLAWVIVVTIGINSLQGLLFFTLLWGLQAGISVQSFYALWASELFPAKYRAAAQGVMFFIVRALSAVWGLVFVYIYGENGEGFTLAATIMMCFFIISLLIGTIWAPVTRGKSLEQITRERYGDDF
ncbi:MAG: MFS transporter [Alistipes sp.]|nr:MFS transporter [Rikenellaceae bacterium]MBQ8916048.1 MFS transporter [Alistipes sp.]